jgi:uncharacterized membrane protein YdfJ with MMPL/SSD domain
MKTNQKPMTLFSLMVLIAFLAYCFSDLDFSTGLLIAVAIPIVLVVPLILIRSLLIRPSLHLLGWLRRSLSCKPFPKIVRGREL